MTTFVKSNGLKEVGRSKIRNYENVDCVWQAICCGDLLPGDLFTTVAAHGITEDITSVICCLVDITPNSASRSNMLVTQRDLAIVSDISALTARVCTNEDNIATNTSNIASNTSTLNQIGARTGVNETNISNLQSDLTTKVTCTDYSTFVTNTNDTLACKVDCIDFTDYVTCTNTFISNQETINSDVQTAFTTKVTCTDFTPIVTTVNNLTTCPGLDCTGVVVALNHNGSVVNPTNGIITINTCKGTVTAICNTTRNTTCNPNANGVISIQIPQFTVSGSVLTITE